MAASTPDIGKLKRSYLLHFIDASFGTGESPKWYLIGKDIDDMSVELSPDTSTVKNILDETSVNDNGYEPTGHHIKNEIREIAEEEHLINAKRKDSQGICFLGQINYNDYIRRYLGENPGDVIEMETGKRIGTHKGLWFHTIGQRKGLGFGGGPWFVIKKDVEKNILYVSHGYDPQTAYKKDFPLQDFHFLTREVAMQKVTFKIRHTPEYHPATIEKLEDGRWMIHSEEAIHGVAPGQFCVVYDENHHRCYGSGEITV